MEPSGSRLRAEMLKASGAAWPYGSPCGLVALMGLGGRLLALFLALLLRAFSGVKAPPKASPQPAPPDGRSIGSGCRAAGRLIQSHTGDGDTENAKARPVGSGTEVAPSSSAHVARLSWRGRGTARAGPPRAPRLREMAQKLGTAHGTATCCLLYTSPSPRD